MNIFLAVLAALSFFMMMVQMDNQNRRTYLYCFIATIAVIGALEIIPLFLA